MKLIKFFSLVLALFLLLGTVTGCGDMASTAIPESTEDLAHANIGVVNGTIYRSVVQEEYPHATISTFDQVSDMFLALESGKIHAFMEEETVVVAAAWAGKDYAIIEESEAHSDVSFVCNKQVEKPFVPELNAFLLNAKEAGLLERLSEKWLGEEEPTDHPRYQHLPDIKGTIRVGADPSMKPMSYMVEGMATGYEIELLTLFAEEMGYALKIDPVSFDAILPGVISDKYDLGVSSLTITEERMESVRFLNPHFASHGVIAAIPLHSGFIPQEERNHPTLTENFSKTFLRESRWKMILSGLFITLVIALFSTIGGSLLGFLLYLATRGKNPYLASLTRGFGKVYSRIIAGTPVVVILMLLFYVIFGQFRSLSGIVIAILGFTLVFGSFVYSQLGVSVSSVDIGQTEAAYALGYSKNRAFFRIVLPQALRTFLPVYCGEVISLIKSTSVVGYIAVNDLTRVGDIIRSNTYEAFFPLLSVAVIYFLITWMVEILLTLLARRLEPKYRSEKSILKGVSL